MYVNDVLQPARAWAPVHAAFDCVNAMCGKTWNLAVVCAVAPIPSTTTTLNSQSAVAPAAGAGNALVKEKPFSPIPLGIAPEITL